MRVPPPITNPGSATEYVLVSIIWGHNTWPLYGVEGWPPTRGFLSTILYGDAIGTKVSGRYRQGGRPSGVAVKRGSTVVMLTIFLNFSESVASRQRGT